MQTTGIYLDEPFTNALIVRGYSEGIIPSLSEGRAPYDKRFLANFTNPKLANVALQTLVLYQKVYLDPRFDNFDIRGLQAENIVDLPRVGIRYELGSNFRHDEFIAQGLLYPALAHMRSLGKNTTEAELRQAISDGSIERWQTLNQEKLHLQVANVITRSKIGNRQLQAIEAELDSLEPLYKTVSHVIRLTDASTELGVPVLWECQATPTSKLTQVEHDDLLVAGIYFRGLKHVKLNSLSDAIQLRSNNAVEDFRQEILGVIEKIRRGTITEQDVHKRIALANRILKLSNLAGKAGTWITIGSLPALAFAPLGAVLTVAGVGLVAANFCAKKRLSWTFLSSGL